jgi:hypothetical protein
MKIFYAIKMQDINDEKIKEKKPRQKKERTPD